MTMTRRPFPRPELVAAGAVRREGHAVGAAPAIPGARKGPTKWQNVLTDIHMEFSDK